MQKEFDPLFRIVDKNSGKVIDTFEDLKGLTLLNENELIQIMLPATFGFTWQEIHNFMEGEYVKWKEAQERP